MLRQQPTNRVVAERLMSALSHRSFCLPSAPALEHDKPLFSAAYPKADPLSDLAIFIRLGGAIRSCNFSPDRGKLVTASMDGTARIWNGRTGTPVGERLGHEAEVLWAQFSPDGSRVATASLNKTARAWDANTGEPKTPPLTWIAAHTLPRPLRGRGSG